MSGSNLTKFSIITPSSFSPPLKSPLFKPYWYPHRQFSSHPWQQKSHSVVKIHKPIKVQTHPAPSLVSPTTCLLPNFMINIHGRPWWQTPKSLKKRRGIDLEQQAMFWRRSPKAYPSLYSYTMTITPLIHSSALNLWALWGKRFAVNCIAIS